jgi:hypothetical protein
MKLIAIVFFLTLVSSLQAQVHYGQQYKRNYISIVRGGATAYAGLIYERQILTSSSQGLHLMASIGIAESAVKRGWYNFSSTAIGINYISKGWLAVESGISLMPFFLENSHSDLPGFRENGVYGILNFGIRIKPRFRNGIMLKAAWNPIIGREGVNPQWGSIGIGYSFKSRSAS